MFKEQAAMEILEAIKTHVENAIETDRAEPSSVDLSFQSTSLDTRSVWIDVRTPSSDSGETSVELEDADSTEGMTTQLLDSGSTGTPQRKSHKSLSFGFRELLGKTAGSQLGLRGWNSLIDPDERLPSFTATSGAKLNAVSQ